MESLVVVAAVVFAAGVAAYYFLQKRKEVSKPAVMPEPSPEPVEPEASENISEMLEE